jgi:hypothetical protein
VVGAYTAPGLARGLHAFLGRGKSMPRGSGTPVLMLQGLGEAKIVSRRGARVGRFDDVMGAQARRKPALASGDLSADTLLMPWLGMPIINT